MIGTVRDRDPVCTVGHDDGGCGHMAIWVLEVLPEPAATERGLVYACHPCRDIAIERLATQGVPLLSTTRVPRDWTSDGL